MPKLFHSRALILTGTEYESACKIANSFKTYLLRKRIAEKLYDKFGEHWEFYYLCLLVAHDHEQE